MSKDFAGIADINSAVTGHITLQMDLCILGHIGRTNGDGVFTGHMFLFADLQNVLAGGDQVEAIGLQIAVQIHNGIHHTVLQQTHGNEVFIAAKGSQTTAQLESGHIATHVATAVFTDVMQAKGFRILVTANAAVIPVPAFIVADSGEIVTSCGNDAPVFKILNGQQAFSVDKEITAFAVEVALFTVGFAGCRQLVNIDQDTDMAGDLDAVHGRNLITSDLSERSIGGFVAAHDQLTVQGKFRGSHCNGTVAVATVGGLNGQSTKVHLEAVDLQTILLGNHGHFSIIHDQLIAVHTGCIGIDIDNTLIDDKGC